MSVPNSSAAYADPDQRRIQRELRLKTVEQALNEGLGWCRTQDEAMTFVFDAWKVLGKVTQHKEG